MCRTAHGVSFVLIICVSLGIAHPSFAVITIFGGDYNGDGLVTPEDAAVWASEYGGPAMFADGNGDFVVDQQDYDIVYMDLGIGPAALEEGPAALLSHSVSELLYNSSTGEVVLDQTAAVGPILAFKLLSSGGNFAGPGVAQFPFPINATMPGDMSDTSVDTTAEIGQIDISLSGLPTDQFSLGNILPPGLSQMQVETDLAASFYMVDDTGLTYSFAISVVPEPAAAVLASFAGCMIAGASWRRFFR